MQGAPITTIDVAIVHNQSKENISKLITFLKSVDAIHRRPDDKTIEPKEREISGKGHVLLTTRLGPLDILAVIEGERNYQELLYDTVEIEFRGHIIRVLNLKKIVEIKKSSYNIKDKLRLPILEETLRQIEKESK